MKLRRSIFTLFLAAVFVGFATETRADLHSLGKAKVLSNYCSYILSTYLELHDTAADSSEIDEELEEAKNLTLGTTVPFTPTDSLAPIFKRGFFLRALGDELRSRGYRTSEAMHDALFVLVRPENRKDLLTLTTNVWARTLAEIGILDGRTDSESIKRLQERSKELGLPFDEFFDLLDALRNISDTDFHVIKLAYLHEILTAHSRLADQIPKRGTWSRIFSKTPAAAIIREEPLRFDGANQEEKIVDLKMRNLVKLSLAPSASFGDFVLATVQEVTTHYGVQVSQEFEKKTFLQLLDLASLVPNEAQFQSAFAALYQYAAARQFFNYPLATKLVSILEVTTRRAPARSELYARFLTDVKKRIDEVESAKIVTKKIDELESFGSRHSAFSFGEAFSKELNDFHANYASRLEINDFIRAIRGFIPLTRTLRDVTVFENSLQLILQTVQEKKVSPNVMIEPLLDLESTLRYTQPFNLNRADFIHNTFLRSEPILYQPRVPSSWDDHWGGCFVAGTLVDTPQGPRAIETLRAGDEVFAYDIDAKKVVISHVTHPLVHFARPYVRVLLKDGSHLDVTTEHPFYSASHEDFVPLRELPEGVALLKRNNQNNELEPYPLRIDFLSGVTRFANVYNLEVEEFHNYFVGGILVHNGGGTK